MIPTKTPEEGNSLAMQAADSADRAIRSTQRVAHQALDGVAGSARDMRAAAAPLLDRAADQASTLAHRGLDAVLEGSHQLRDKARHAGDSTIGYIRDEPLKSVLIAAATGAALMALIALMSRSRA